LSLKLNFIAHGRGITEIHDFTICTDEASDCLHLRLVFVVHIQEKPSQAIIVIVEGNLDLNILADQI